MNTAKSRKKYHNVVYLVGGGCDINDAREVERTPFYTGQVRGEKHALILPMGS